MASKDSEQKKNVTDRAAAAHWDWDYGCASFPIEPWLPGRLGLSSNAGLEDLTKQIECFVLAACFPRMASELVWFSSEKYPALISAYLV